MTAMGGQDMLPSRSLPDSARLLAGSALVLLLCTAVCATPGANTQGGARPDSLIQIGASAPDFSANAHRGGQVRLSDFKGKVVILDFWGTWCGPSLKGLRRLEKLAADQKGQGVVVLAVARDRGERYEKNVSDRGPSEIIFALDPTPEEDPPIFDRLYHASRMPTTIIIGRDGKVVAAFDGYTEGDDRVEQGLRAAGIAVAR
jgi:peroxiredoxin